MSKMAGTEGLDVCTSVGILTSRYYYIIEKRLSYARNINTSNTFHWYEKLFLNKLREAITRSRRRTQIWAIIQCLNNSGV